MDIEKVSDMYSSQMKIKNINKLINLRTDPPKEQPQRKPSSQFDATEVLAERLLILEKRVDELERRLCR